MKTKKKAISLIVLVITIIVLAILAATVIVSIANSGIINRATDTVRNYDLAEVRSMASLAWAEALMDSTVVSDADYENYVKQYLTNAGVDITDYEITVSANGVSVFSWNAIFANAKQPHPDQDVEGVIGIDYKGNLVDMDLWNYSPYSYEANASGGTYGDDLYGDDLYGDDLYGGDAYDMDFTVVNYSIYEYTGNIVGGKVQSEIPQYIKAEGDTEFKPVVTMHFTFFEKTDLVESPVLPKTLTDVENIFQDCTALAKAPELPKGLSFVNGMFDGCTSLTGTIKLYGEDMYVCSNAGPDFVEDTCNVTLLVPKGTVTYGSVYSGYATSENVKIETYDLEARPTLTGTQYADVTTLEAGDYVSYTLPGGDMVTCIVLYDINSGYNDVQIISKDTVDSWDLGYADFSKSARSYNRAIDLLNGAAAMSLNYKLATSARCVGSVPNNPSNSGAIIEINDSYVDIIMDTDTNSAIDLAQMETLSILTADQDYWLASREQDYNLLAELRIRYFNTTSNAEDKVALTYLEESSTYGPRPYGRVSSKALRPVITLRLDTKIVDGQGTAESPYVLGR